MDKKITVSPANNYAVNELNFGDTLDQDYISQQFNRGANREFGKTYYVDTNNFFSQGKFEVKTTFASSPLIYLAGTGVSGSASGGGPIATSIGDCILSYSSNPATWCLSTPYVELFSSTGVLEPSAVLYYDAYGNSSVTGYRYVTDKSIGSSTECDVYSINPYTGIVDTYIDNCSNLPYGCV